MCPDIHIDKTFLDSVVKTNEYWKLVSEKVMEDLRKKREEKERFRKEVLRKRKLEKENRKKHRRKK